jgi:hypothetical protein
MVSQTGWLVRVGPIRGPRAFDDAPLMVKCTVGKTLRGQKYLLRLRLLTQLSNEDL